MLHGCCLDFNVDKHLACRGNKGDNLSQFKEQLERFFSERKPTQHFAIAILATQALVYIISRSELLSAIPDLFSKYPFGTYNMEGRPLVALALFVLGVVAYVILPSLTVTVLGVWFVWRNLLDSAISSSIGGRQVWAEFSYFNVPLSTASILLEYLSLFALFLISFTIVWVLTKAYRQRVIKWIDSKGAEVSKSAADYEHTSPLAIISLVLAFIFPIGSLLLAAIAKRDIALARQKVGGVDLIVAANMIGVIFLILQSLVILGWLNTVFGFIPTA
jgi:hypothetical protein